MVPEQRDRYREDIDESIGDERGAREDYGDWLSTCAKDSQELLRRQRVALPDVHEYTRFVLESRQMGSIKDELDATGDSLDLDAIGACLRELPLDVMLGTPAGTKLEKDLLRRIRNEDTVADCDREYSGDNFVRSGASGEPAERGEEQSATKAPAQPPPATETDLAAELDAFLGIKGDESTQMNDTEIFRTEEASTLEADLEWFDQL